MALLNDSCELTPCNPSTPFHVTWTRVFAITMAVVCCGMGDYSYSQERVHTPELKSMVESLASRNVPPREMAPASPRFPPNYSVDEQRRVQTAIIALLDKGSEAFPELMSQFDDDRYCVTVQADNGIFNRSVGFVCRDIVRAHIEGVYAPFLREFDPDHPKYVAQSYLDVQLKEHKGKDRWIRWWESKRAGGLVAVQLDALRWAIRVEKGRGFDSRYEEAASIGSLEYLVRVTEQSGLQLVPNGFAESYVFHVPKGARRKE